MKEIIERGKENREEEGTKAWEEEYSGEKNEGRRMGKWKKRIKDIMEEMTRMSATC